MTPRTATAARALLATGCLLLGGTRPAAAQVDLTGMWAPLFHEDQVERIPGPDVGDYAGLPINEALQFRADSWDASLLTLPEHQCKPHPSTYGFRGVGNLRITGEVDDKTQAVVRLRTHIQWQEQRRDIWMDGRPHPPDYAAHTWQGFSTGRWEGDTLVVRTTHLKAGWIRRNGMFITDQATMTERFIRHGDVLTHIYMIEDPNYLTEPLIKTNGFRLTSNPAMQPYPCYPTVEVPRPKGEVPHHLPGENTFLEEYARNHDLPVAAVRGGAGTALPEFMRASPPPRAVRTSAPARPAGASGEESEVRSLHVQGNVWMLVGPGVNAAVQIGDDGVLVVDTMTGSAADAMVAEIRRLAGDRPIRWIINTHGHPDHTGGNAVVAEAGESIIAGNFVGQAGADAAGFAKIIAHENVATRMAQADPPLPVVATPTDTFFSPEFEIFFNGEAVQMMHRPNAHSDGDVLVFFRKSDVVVAGDLFLTTSFPVLDLAHGGSLNGVVSALNAILDITVPADKQEGGTYVIPGHGRLTDEADVVEYRDMVTILRDRVQHAISSGRTLDEIKGARLARDYEGRYGALEGPGTTDAFLEAAYESVRRE